MHPACCRVMASRGAFLCLASAAAFGAMAIFGKLAFDEGVSAGTLLAVRFVLASAVLWGVLLARGAVSSLRALPRRDVALALGLGACGYAGQAGRDVFAVPRRH